MEKFIIIGRGCLKKEYYDADETKAKTQFVKDFIQYCRDAQRVARDDGLGMTTFVNKFVVVGREFWQFGIYASADKVWTEAHLFRFDYSKNPPADISTHYPKTEWGGSYSRWDCELREFLNREICKK